MDAAEYKHIVLGLIFMKYISDIFLIYRIKLRDLITDPNAKDFFVGNDPDIIEETLNEKDFYTSENIFWVPKEAQWEFFRNHAKENKGNNIGEILDKGLILLERENLSLKGKLDRRFGKSDQQLEPGCLAKLVDLISTIAFGEEDKSQDILGDVYEYFLGKFAKAEGKLAGSFYTPSHVVKVLVEILAPHQGRVYDPCCGSGGMFVQSESFLKSHGGNKDNISIYGQESSFTTWRLAAMNLAIRGVSANLGETNADTFARDQFPDQKFDFILANPPFNIKKWNGENYSNDVRWQFGRPPVGNANYAWLQHILWKLRPGGQAGVVLANGSMSSNTSNEGNIREEMVRKDVVEVMVALPGQLFLNTQIPVCLWFLTNDKTQRGRDRKGETLFIDARQMGTMKSRVEKILTDDDISKIADTVYAWRNEEAYKDIPGFCYKATFEEIEKNNFVLTPGRYVGAIEEESDGEPFDEKMKRLTLLLKEQQEEGAKLDKQITENLKKIGYFE